MINDSSDFEIKSGTVFNESFYYTIDTLSDKLNNSTAITIQEARVTPENESNYFITGYTSHF